MSVISRILSSRSRVSYFRFAGEAAAITVSTSLVVIGAIVGGLFLCGFSICGWRRKVDYDDSMYGTRYVRIRKCTNTSSSAYVLKSLPVTSNVKIYL